MCWDLDCGLTGFLGGRVNTSLRVVTSMCTCFHWVSPLLGVESCVDQVILYVGVPFIGRKGLVKGYELELRIFFYEVPISVKNFLDSLVAPVIRNNKRKWVWINYLTVVGCKIRSYLSVEASKNLELIM